MNILCIWDEQYYVLQPNKSSDIHKFDKEGIYLLNAFIPVVGVSEDDICVSDSL